MSVSVLIPVRGINHFVRESVLHLLSLQRSVIEVLVLPDTLAAGNGFGVLPTVMVVPTGEVGPAEKRDRGAQLARGDILAFLDDDAYPDMRWLEEALPHFAQDAVAAVGGPTVTPPHDSFLQQASGWALATLLGSGAARMRYLPVGNTRDVDDWPSVNLLVRRSDFLAVGGFDCTYYPGEDTKLCLDITTKLGKRIVYEPKAIVYHHRRSLLPGHFQQIGRYAVHRGYFAKVYPKTSLRLSYFLPTLFVLALVVGACLSPLSRPLRAIYTGAVAVYAAALGATGVSVGVRSRQPLLGLVAALAVAATHVWYGLSFLRGLATRELKR